MNRLIGSLLWTSFPQLNVTPPYLGEPGIGFRRASPATSRFKTMTGSVLSGEPTQEIVLTLNLLKTQPLSQLYEAQIQTLTALGNCVLRPDVTTLGPWYLQNCSIDDVAELEFSGKVPGYVVTIGGYYIINSTLWL